MASSAPEVADAPVGPQSRAPLGLLGTILVVVLGGIVAGMDRLNNMDMANKERTANLNIQMIQMQGMIEALRLSTEAQGRAYLDAMTRDQFQIYMLRLHQANPTIKLPE